MRMTHDERESRGQNTDVKDGYKKEGKDPQVDFLLQHCYNSPVFFPGELVFSFCLNLFHPQEDFHLFSFLPSVWPFSLVGTAAVPPVFLAT